MQFTINSVQWAVKCEHDGQCGGVGDFDANLCMSKCRVCPMRGYTVPRSELCGALLVSRLMLAVVTALCRLDEAPASAVMILDSRCVISALEMTSSKALPFFQNRLAEIHENLETVAKRCEVEPVLQHSETLVPPVFTRRDHIFSLLLGRCGLSQGALCLRKFQKRKSGGRM